MNYLDASIRGIRKKIRTTSIARPCAARHSLSPFLGHGHILISYFHHQTCLRYSQNTHWTKSSRPKVLSWLLDAFGKFPSQWCFSASWQSVSGFSSERTGAKNEHGSCPCRSQENELRTAFPFPNKSLPKFDPPSCQRPPCDILQDRQNGTAIPKHCAICVYICSHPQTNISLTLQAAGN